MLQRFKMRSSAGKDVIMDPKLRIVQCPKCKAYLQEPPVGNPFYECGSCFITLQGKLLQVSFYCRITKRFGVRFKEV